MGTTFKTCLFGGFDREDVISYIEKTAQENQERIRELTETIESLQSEKETALQDREAMDEELASLRDNAARFQSLSEKYEALRARIDEVVERANQLDEENKQLRVQADEYQSLKDHIADIEISAHRRTQEFRAAAISQLHALVAQQQDQFARQRSQFGEVYSNVRSQLEAAQEALGTLDLSGFDQIEQQLTDLDSHLDE